MARYTILLALVLAACSDRTDPPTFTCEAAPFGTPPQAASSIAISGLYAKQETGKASAHQSGSGTVAYTIVSGFTVNPDNRPASEIVVFFPGSARVRDMPLVPVTLDEINDPGFVPAGAFAVYAEAYDQSVGDYTRYLLGKTGCARIRSVSPGTPGDLVASVRFDGEWRSNTDARLGSGRAVATMNGLLIDLRVGAPVPRDSMRAEISGVRAAPYSATTLDAFQVLHPEQTRLVIVGTQAADSTREIWLSINGVPERGDSVPLQSVTLAEATATRPSSPKPFAMMRVLEFEGTSAVVREVWTSVSGWVKFDEVVDNSPLALCGAATGRFAFTAQGTSLSMPGSSLGQSTFTSGAFTTRTTIVAPSDTLIDPARRPPVARRTFSPAAPRSTMGFACP